MALFAQLSTFRIGMFNKPSKSAQDRLFTYRTTTNDFIALGVIDGHGRGGEISADNVCVILQEICATTNEAFLVAPNKWLNDAFELINTKLAEIGTYGGATCTLCIIANNTLYIAHVGDSSALLVTREPILNSSMIKALQSIESSIEESIGVDYLLLGDDHSPDNPVEYQRMRTLNPNVQCVYDRSTVCGKYSLPSVFAEKKQMGYYKNVRSDPATLVVKQSGRSLAMTRSLGDFQMKPEVTYVPTIQQIDLISLIGLSCIIIASDGVWDNWTYPEVREFFTSNTNWSSDASDVATTFCLHNDIKATENFGNSKDDASGIIVYF